MSRTRPRPHRVAETVRGVGALTILVALLAGAPILLIRLTHTVAPRLLPRLVDAEALLTLLTRPDDGTVFLAALLLLVWAAWAGTVVSTAVELVAQLRSRPTPR